MDGGVHTGAKPGEESLYGNPHHELPFVESPDASARNQEPIPLFWPAKPVGMAAEASEASVTRAEMAYFMVVVVVVMKGVNDST